MCRYQQTAKVLEGCSDRYSMRDADVFRYWEVRMKLPYARIKAILLYSNQDYMKKCDWELFTYRVAEMIDTQGLLADIHKGRSFAGCKLLAIKIRERQEAKNV